MFNFLIKNKLITIPISVVMIFSFGSQIYGFDLLSKIEDSFQEVYDKGASNEYLNMPYSSVYPKDPYRDELKNTEDMKTQLKLSGVDMVEQALEDKDCPMSRKKVRGILYYYVPEFREDLARNLKMENGDTDVNKFILEKKKIIEYCTEHYKCDTRNFGRYKGNRDTNDSGEITARTPKDVETNCKEFFQTNYKEGQDNKSRNQSVEESQLGNDKYRNATVEDSPYDIMSDFGVIGQLLFEEAQEPIQPVFYHLPMFRNANKAAEDYKNGVENDNSDKGQGESFGGQGGQGGQGGGQGGEGNNPGNPGGGNGGGGSQHEGDTSSLLDEYDDLIEGLGASSLNLNNGINGKICGDETLDEEPTNETNQKSTSKGNQGDKEQNEDSGESGGDTKTDNPEITEEDFNNYMSHLQDLVDKYTDDRVGKSQREKTKEEIEKCFEGCKGLRVDQKLSCKMMCACGEVDSPIFDPEKTEGLGPIFKIRFCTVPAQNMRFSAGGRRVVSIEEGINEIYGVVDKLSREGKLGIWTQQNNYLDSSTKKIKIADNFAFSIDVEWVDIANRLPNYSTEYREYIAKKNNEKWQKLYKIQNPTNDPVAKNRYGALAKHNQTVSDVSSVLNTQISIDEKESLASDAKLMVDPNGDSNASRYTSLSSSLFILISQQASFRINASAYTQDFNDYATALYAKKDQSKK